MVIDAKKEGKLELKAKLEATENENQTMQAVIHTYNQQMNGLTEAVNNNKKKETVSIARVAGNERKTKMVGPFDVDLFIFLITVFGDFVSGICCEISKSYHGEGSTFGAV